MENKVPDILLVYPSEFLDELIEKEVLYFNSETIDIKVMKSDNQAFMAFEWIIPTGFIVYILKPYLDAFLSEAGKDHYHFLKKGLKKIIVKGKFIKAKLLTAKSSTEKLSKTYSQSIVISIIFQTKDFRLIKLLFDNELELSEWENAIDKMIELLTENYESSTNDKLSKMINSLNADKKDEIFAVINQDNKQLELLDDDGMRKRYK